MNSFASDLDLLGITSITINIPITAMMYTYPAANTIEHEYGGRRYYFSRNYLNGIDEALRLTASREIVVAAIILIQKAAECVDPEIGRLLQHPAYTPEGIYTMPNLTTDRESTVTPRRSISLRPVTTGPTTVTGEYTNGSCTMRWTPVSPGPTWDGSQ